MTDTTTDTIDLGRLAVVGESFATPDNQASVTIVAIDAAPELRTDFRSWEFIVGSVRVVLVDVSDGLGHPTGIIEHFASELATEPVELGSCDAGSVQGSVLLIEGPQGPALVAFISPVTVVTPPTERRETADAGLSSGLLSLGVLREVPLEVSAELGHTRLSVAEILQLTVGSVIELDRTAGSPVDVVVNGSLIARGEVVVIEDEYGVRITEIVGRIDDTL